MTLLQLSFGSSFPIQILVIEPLFEEANRCRRLVVRIMRTLAENRIGSRLALLPGQGESETGIAEVNLDDWRAAVAAQRERLVVSLRGGCLIDTAATPDAIWRFSPETGERVIRDLRRAEIAGQSGAGFAGHALSEPMIEALAAARCAPHPEVRTVRLDTEAGEADVRFAASPPWRRAEPGDDPHLATGLAEDIAVWARQCAGC